MGKQEIIDYVMRSPYNTNKSVLRSMMGSLDEGGIKYHICSSTEIDSDTGKPFIENPDEKIIYLVSVLDEGNNLYDEYIWANNNWELFGSAKQGVMNLVDGSAQGSVRGIGTKQEDNNYQMGDYAFTEGSYTGASGSYSHAEGDSTFAFGSTSHAEGKGSLEAIIYPTQLGNNTTAIIPGAKSNYSHTEGYQTTTNENTTAVHAEGYQTIAGKIGSGGLPGDHAEGFQTYAAGGASHAEGNGTKATGTKSHAEGSSTTASGDQSHAEGSGTTAGGSNSHAEGNQTETSGEAAHAEGYKTKATKTYAHVEGNNSTASGIASHAEGTSTTASGNQSHAEGAGTIASGNHSHAEGSGTTASGESSHAEGAATVASGQASHTEGYGTTVRGDYSHAEGHYTKATHFCQHVFGEYNIEDGSTAAATHRGTYVEIVGNGTYTTPSNARTLDWSGNESLQGSLTLGKGTADEVTVTAAQLKQLLALLNS